MQQLTLMELEPDWPASLAELNRRCTAARSGTCPASVRANVFRMLHEV